MCWILIGQMCRYFSMERTQKALYVARKVCRGSKKGNIDYVIRIK